MVSRERWETNALVVKSRARSSRCGLFHGLHLSPFGQDRFVQEKLVWLWVQNFFGVWVQNFLITGTRQQLAKVNINCMRVGSTDVCPVTVARNLKAHGLMSSSLCQLILASYVVLPFTICIISNAFASICLENQRKCLSMDLLHLVLIITTVFCMGCPTTSLTNCRELNASARLVCSAPRFCHISPLLRGLHWLPVKARTHFKIPLITFKAIHRLAPKYLCELLTFKPSLYNLRSSGSVLVLSMPDVRSKTILGDRTSMVAAPTLWNSLPKELQAITNVNSIKVM